MIKRNMVARAGIEPATRGFQSQELLHGSIKSIRYARRPRVNVTGSDLNGHTVTGVGHDLVTQWYDA